MESTGGRDLNSIELSSSFQVPQHYYIQFQNLPEWSPHFKISDSLFLKKAMNHFFILLPVHKH